ncbi:MAG: 1-(5-phosphoribosyl)-5-[(5-phosphoribosylamino)methylideneamino]imidazole-4-carboxamide isomerase [Ruminococcaceae bacterium]|nr:1-(5-phosphoribosyl)-5-[(5-phosphoribosylamino)methylideneamino]imidazole-4-carboxamide isomerase [Oscillospiraceae bacterium]
MIIFPAIDLYDGKAVRLYKGDYAQMTVYDDDPSAVAARFKAAGATHMHMVDLEGAKTGGTPNLETIKAVVKNAGLFVELGGGIRSFDVMETYLDAGVSRLILGTAAVTDEGFAAEAVKRFGSAVAVGVDVKDGFVAVKGWTEKSSYTCFDFCRKMRDCGVKTIICTDIFKDGAMMGTNRELYKNLSAVLDINIIASGGVSSLEDIQALTDMGLYGAIIGKAYYTGAIDLAAAIEIGADK